MFEFLLSIIEGFHVPVIPFRDVTGNAGTLSPEQIVSDNPKLNTGATMGFTVTSKVVVVAHCPGEAVNVYIAEF